MLLVAGSGCFSIQLGEDVPDKALVRVHYNGYLEYADEPYDSSRLRGKQQQFLLGNGMGPRLPPEYFYTYLSICEPSVRCTSQ